MSRESIKQRLAKIQRDDDALRIAIADGVDQILDELKSTSPKELSALLLDWYRDGPDAVDLLLRSAARSDEHALVFARALVQLLTLWPDGDGPWVGIEDVLIRAFPKLGPPERDWVAERPAVREKYGLVPNRDFIPMGEVDEKDQWPSDQELPPLDDVRGIQARLLRAGYNSGAITGAWNDATRRALVRYQVEHAIPPSGELDRATRVLLEEED
jgi:hypothetical protein